MAVDVDSDYAVLGAKDLHLGKSAVSENFSSVLGEAQRRGVKHDTGGDALSVPSVRGMGRVAGVECGKLVGELSRELLAGAHEAADAAHVWNISSAEPL